MAAGDLVTLDAVKAYLSQNRNDPFADEVLERIISEVSEWFCTQTRRRLGSGEHHEIKTGRGGPFVVTREYPVTAVSALIVNGESVPASTGYGVTGYLPPNGDAVVRLRGMEIRTGDEVEITYTAGYAEGAIPADLSGAAIQLVAVRYRERQHIGTQSESMAGMNVSYLPSIVPQSVQGVVDAYSRTGLA